MKTPEDEAFDELARKQGAWGGGFPAKRQMAADKLQEDVLNYGTAWSEDGKRIDPMSVYKEPVTEREALKLALEALEELNNTNSHWWQEVDRATIDKIDPAIIAIKEALAQPAQEPVAWMHTNSRKIFVLQKPFNWEIFTPLYTTTPQRPWVGLTDADIADCMEMSIQKTCRAVEVKLKERNS